MNKLVLAAFVTVLLAACSSQQTKDGPSTQAKVEDRNVGQAGDAASTQAAPSTGAQSQALNSGANDPLRDPRSLLSRRSVYFSLDSSSVEDEYRNLVEAHAKYLAGKPAARVTLQGNTDERGSREYNLALGQRRADSVKRMMSVMGVSESKIETVSFGEEKPKLDGHDESAWKENRRADIIYQGE